MGSPPNRRAPVFLLALCLLGALAAAPGARAAIESPFAARFATAVRGDFTVAANTLMTCPDNGGTEAKCLESRAGIGGLAALNNNAYEMERVDVDVDAASFDSSTSTLSLPPGATVLFAGLYYGARTSKGEGASAQPAPNPAARGSVLIRPPGALAYTPLAATVTDSTAIAAAYTGFADVTGLVASAGSGDYTVADVQAGTGVDRFAGWALVVAYKDPSAPPCSIRVYDGLASIQSTDPSLQITVDGLETPPAGPVAASVGVVAYEGDRGSSGDRLTFAGKRLADAVNPENNVFSSSIAIRGANVATKTPNYLNQLGFDTNVLAADGILGNGATAATLEESTSVEQYLTQAVAVSIELDPEALEPPAPPAPPAPSPPPPAAGSGSKPKSPGKGKGDEGAKPEPPRLLLSVEESGGPVARPGSVVGIEVTVDSAGEQAVSGVEACTALPAGLVLLRAPGAQVEGATACDRLGKIAPGRSRSLRFTALVKTTDRARLPIRTVVRAANAPTRRLLTRLRVAPLPNAPCGVFRPTDPVANASC